MIESKLGMYTDKDYFLNLTKGQGHRVKESKVKVMPVLNRDIVFA